MKLVRLILILAAWPLHSGCVGKVIPHPTHFAQRSLAPLVPESVPADLRGYLGFDEAVPKGTRGWLSAGHRLLYRMQFHHGQIDRAWLVAMDLDTRSSTTGQVRWRDGDEPEAVYPITAYTVDVTLHELGSGHRDRTSVPVARSSMDHSLYTSLTWCDELQAAGQTSSDLDSDDQRAYALGLATTLMLFNTWQEDNALSEVLRDVVGIPMRALMGAVLGGGLRFKLDVLLDSRSPRRVELPAPMGERHAMAIPLNVILGGSTVMHAELVATETDAPFHVSAGVLQVRGVHPTDTDRWVEIELVGARTAR